MTTDWRTLTLHIPSERGCARSALDLEAHGERPTAQRMILQKSEHEHGRFRGTY